MTAAEVELLIDVEALVAAAKGLLRHVSWIGSSDHLLKVQVVDKATGEVLDEFGLCPECRDVDSSIRVACRGEGCTAPADMGTPTLKGYVYSCYEHRPTEEDKG